MWISRKSSKQWQPPFASVNKCISACLSPAKIISHPNCTLTRPPFTLYHNFHLLSAGWCWHSYHGMQWAQLDLCMVRQIPMSAPDLLRRISTIDLRYLILVSLVTSGNIGLFTYPCKFFICFFDESISKSVYNARKMRLKELFMHCSIVYSNVFLQACLLFFF